MIYNNITVDDQAIYGLIDCNQFYVSCERAFKPTLEGKPVGVLSNNDGCLVALSPEMKQLGITRGMPGFKIREHLGGQKVYLFSSNYELYGDMSGRVMNILSSMADDIEIYSIDEAFILFSDLSKYVNLFDYAINVRKKVKRETSIPISIGLAKTKTLAKIANKIAKKEPTGVFDFTDSELIENTLKKVNVADVWGIGRQNLKKLYRLGIYTAYDLSKAPTNHIRKIMSVMGERTQLELCGIPCIDLEMTHPSTKSIVCSRSFGKPISDYDDMVESISTFTSSALRNLRTKKLVAKNITIFISTNPFKDTKQYANYMQGSLLDYSAYTPDFIHLATMLLKKIFRAGYLYKKTGVMITDITKQENMQLTMFTNLDANDKKKQIMQALDSINHKFGNDKLFFASSGIEKNWKMRREMVSPRYTTRWEEILRV